jgi:iron complex outermembrane receptor protein
MKGKIWLCFVSVALVLAICFATPGVSWSADSGPPQAAASSDGLTVVAQAATDSGAPAQKTTTQPATPSTKTAPVADAKIVPVTEVTVKAEKEKKPAEGSAEAGYKVENTTTTGPWGTRNIQDTPYSILVTPSELIENVQAPSVDQIFKMNPLIQPWTASARSNGTYINVLLRGFSTATNYSRAEDGMHGQLLTTSLEDKESVEVVTGLTSFLYGPANVGGVINFVNKRPTWTPLFNVTGGNYGGDAYYIHGDFGGPLYKDKIAFRANVVEQNGGTNVDNQHIQRNLLSGALDWRVTDNLLIQFSGGHDEERVDGSLAYWNFASNAQGLATALHPSAPDASKNWGQAWTTNYITTDKGETRAIWNLSDVFTLRAAYKYTEDYQPGYGNTFANNMVTNNSGTYSQTINKNTNQNFISNAGYTFMDAKFKTGFIENKITAGYFGDRLVAKYGTGSYTGISVPNLNFIDPTYIPQQSFKGTGIGPLTRSSTGENRNWIIGDEIKFSKSWSALIGGNYTEILAQNYNTTTRSLTSQYDQNKLTPSASLLYKPVPWVTTYATFMESLEQGQIVPATGTPVYTNKGQSLPPFTSNQYEVGAKATVGGVLLTAALFDIDRALQYAINNNGTYTYVQNGRENHKGFEFTVTGKPTADLTLWGGMTLMDAKIVRNASNPQWNGKTPPNVAEQMIKLYGEYAIRALPGFSLTGGVYYTGQMYADQMNTDNLPAVITEDVGARYVTTLKNYPLILRLNVTNVTNKSYWLDSYYTGDPRRILFSAQIKF